MKAAIAIPLCGALGLLAVLKGALFYYGQDGLGLAIVVLIGGVLLFGIAELYWVSMRTRALRAELHGLPASGEALTLASPLLRSLLRARLDGTSLPVPGPIFAPYLVGLLVLLGLLGTFLGLFETLRGASQALSASADVDALRAGLRAPIGGLMRGFGTSAAAVACSALLGLATVFVRRDNAVLGLSLHATATGALSQYSPAQRELSALESLAKQGEAWPAAAQALTKNVQALQAFEQNWTRAHHTLAQEWREAHKSAASELQAALNAATAQVGVAIARGVEQAAAASGGAIKPLVERALQETTQAASAQLSEMRAALVRDAEAREAQQANAAQALHDQLERHAQSLEAAERARDAARQSEASARHAELDRASAALVEKLERHVERLQQAEQARGEALAEQWRSLGTALRDERAEALERDQARAEALARLSEGLQQSLVVGAQRVAAQVAQSGQAQAALHDRIEALLDRLGQTADTLNSAARDQLAALQGLLSATEAQLQAAQARNEQGMTALLSQWAEHGRAQSERLSAFEAGLLERHEASAERLRDGLALHSSELASGLSQTADVLAKAATLLHGSGVELGAMVEGFAAATEKQREGARAWLESLTEIERAVVQAGEAAAVEALDQHLQRTHELFDQQLQFHQELLEQMRGTRHDSMVAPRADATG